MQHYHPSRPQARLTAAAVSLLCLVLGVLPVLADDAPPAAPPAPEASAQPAPRPSRAERQVRQVLARHFEGVAKADRALLEGAWDVPNAHLKFVTTDPVGRHAVRVEPIETAFTRWTESPTPDAAGRVLAVDLLGSRAAVARVEFTWRGTTYHESLTLLKAGREWRIVNKTYAVASEDDDSGGGAY